MTIEGQTAVTALTYGAGAGALLAIVAIAQRVRISRLEKENDTLTLRYQKHIAARSPKYADLVMHSPYPSVVVDHKGAIMCSNAPFDHLTRGNRIRNIGQFDSLTLAALTKSASSRGRHIQNVTVRETDGERLRQFVAASWPLGNSEEQIGRVITLHEQTNVIRRKASQDHFQREVIELIDSLGTNISAAIEKNDHIGAKQQATQLGEAAAILTTTRPTSHPATAPASAELTDILKTVTKNLKQYASSRGVTLTMTLPRSRKALVAEDDFAFAIHSVLASLIELSKKGDSLRIDLDTTGRRARVSITGDHLGDILSKNVFSFGSKHQSVTSMRLAIAREVLEKHHAHVDIHTLDEKPDLITITAAIDER